MDPEQSEVKAIAQMAEVDPVKMAAGFNDPGHLFDHLTREELLRIKQSCERLAVIQAQMVAAMDFYTAYANGVLATIARGA